MNIIKNLLDRMMASDLKNAFCEVQWVGEIPSLPPDQSVFVYMNHQNYFDGHVVWLLGRRIFNRLFWVWMEEWDRFPFLRILGALPFPAKDLRKRVQVLQFTRKALAEERRDLYFFPEARLHSPNEPLLPFPARLFERVDGLSTAKIWLPIGIRAVIGADARPILQLIAGELHADLDGNESDRLKDALELLSSQTLPTQIVFVGMKNPDKRWNFSFLKPWFDVK